jgi:alpha/beta hydrolase family protein
VPTLDDVRRWRPEDLDVAFGQLGRARDRLLDADADLQAGRTPPGWLGEAADMAGREHERLAERTRRTVAAVTALRPAIARAAETLTEVHLELDRLTALAVERGYRIAPDGAVIPAAELPPPQLDPTAGQRRAADLDELGTGLAGVLRRADELDSTLAAALAAATSGLVDDGTGDGLTDAAVHVLGGERPPSPPPPDATPQQNADWWNSLTPAQQEHLLLTDPGLLGNRDGVPADVRDEANRARLDTETARIDAAITSTQARLDELDAGRPPTRFGEHAVRADQLAELQDQRDALNSIAGSIDAGPDRQLLLLDVDGHDEPRAAVAVGDVSTADHVAVYTPGFTTTVADSLPGAVKDVDLLRQNALNQLDRDGQPGATVAAVAWIGYDIPQWDTLTAPDRTVGTDTAAIAGGHHLARFLDGVTATRPDDPHLTAIGHSYGSTTTGYALQEAHGVDDAVLFGSPGPSTDDLSLLNIPPERIGLIEARHDPVADAGLFGGDPSDRSELTQLSSGSAELPGGQQLHEVTGHERYLENGSTSQHNLAATVAGLPGDRILTDDTSDYGDWLY